MLINTLVLFLTDVLPGFVLMGILLAMIAGTRQWRLILGLLAVALVFTYVVLQQLGAVSELWDGAGLELLNYVLVLLAYVLTLILLSNFYHPNAKLIAALLLLCIWLRSGIGFALFFSGYWYQATYHMALTLGTLMGMGIGASIAALLYLGLASMQRRWGIYSSMVTLLLFVSGQLSQAMNLLVQVDWLNDRASVWNSNWLLTNDSELGYLLNSLLGYDATPNIYQVMCYLIAATLGLAVLWHNRLRASSEEQYD